MGFTKAKLNNGETTLGAWITIPNPIIIEILQYHQFDWLALDLEHAPFDNKIIYEMVRANNSRCDILVRLPTTRNEAIIKQALDAGADGIIFPNVTTIADAQTISSCTKYPPDGARSMAICRANNYGRNIANHYLKHNNKVITVIMIENEYASAHVHDLAVSAGADAVLIGPYDLSASLGISAQFSNQKFRDTIIHIKESVESISIKRCAPGIHVASVDPELVAEYRKMGFRFIACGLDTEMLRFGAKNAIPK